MSNQSESATTAGRANPLLLEALFAYRGVLCLIAFAAIVFAYAFYVPRFRNTFADFKTSLPTATEWTLNVADWFTQGFGWLIVPVLILLLLGARSCLDWSLRVRRARWHHFVMPMLFLLLFLVSFGFFHYLTMTLPLMKLIQSVSGGSE